MELHPELERLLLEKPFSLLDAGEKELVKDLLSPEDYDAYRLALLAAGQIKRSTPAPPPRLEAKLMAAFNHQTIKREKAPLIKRLSHHRSPSWLLVAAASVGLVIGLFFQRQPEPALKASPQIVYRTDTVYIKTPAITGSPTPVSEQISSGDPEFKHPKTAAPEKHKKTDVHTSLAIEYTKEVAGIAENPPVKKGSSLSTDPRLMELVVKVY